MQSSCQPWRTRLRWLWQTPLSYREVLRYRDILLDDNRFLNRELLSQAGDEIIGGNSGLRNVMEMVLQVAPLSNTVLLMGETGTGKEVIANAIHFASLRERWPLHQGQLRCHPGKPY